MMNRATRWTIPGLLAAIAVAGSPACSKDKKAPEEPVAEAPPADAPPPEEAPPADEPPPDEAAPAEGEAGAEADPAAAGGGMAVAEMKPASKSKVSGTITFTEKDGQTEVAIDLKGLKPGQHGFHIHEKGDCSAPDATSAGGHFNPDGKKHGAPDAAEHHAGDFGNIKAGKDGTVKTTITVDFVTVSDGPNSAVGKAVIVHAKKDDLKTQPTGDAGGRVACGVVAKQ